MNRFYLIGLFAVAGVVFWVGSGELFSKDDNLLLTEETEVVETEMKKPESINVELIEESEKEEDNKISTVTTGRFVDEVLIPVPGEVFSVLDKLGAPNWKDYGLNKKLPLVGERDRLAFLFGVTVAEGFLATEAEDRIWMEAIGADLLRFSKALGLRETVDKHAGLAMKAVEVGDWEKVRREFDRSEVTVREMMKKMQDDDLAELVSFGGWVRGLQATSSVVLDDYSVDGAELLSQKYVVEVFLNRISENKKGIHQEVRDRLVEMNQILDDDAEIEAIDAPKVQQIHKLCSQLLASVAGWKEVEK